MKIALLAPSSAGKTSYLTGLYGKHVLDLNETRYPLNFESTDSRASMRLKDYLSQLINLDYPDGSSSIQKYPITLKAKREFKTPALESNPFNIEIMDFPGGWISKTEDPKDMENLIEELSQCDGYIVLMDGEVLIETMKKNDKYVLENNSDANKIRLILGKAIDRRIKRNAESDAKQANEKAFDRGQIPIAIGITKLDLLDEYLMQYKNDTDSSHDDNIKRAHKYLLTQIFNGEAFNRFDKSHTMLANIVQEHFHTITDNENVANMQIGVSVVNEKLKRLELTHVEYLFQFNLFIGLQNAVTDMAKRLKHWDKTKRNKDKDSDEYKELFDQYSRKYESKGWWARTFSHFSDNDTSELREKRDRYSKSYYRDLAQYNSAKVSLEDVREVMKAYKELMAIVLGHRFVNDLQNPSDNTMLIQDGINVDLYKNTSWWGRKIMRHKAVKEIEKRTGDIDKNFEELFLSK